MSADFLAHGHSEGGEYVQAVDAGGRFCFLGLWFAGFQLWADDGFVAEHGGFGQGSSVISGLAFPFFSPDFGDPLHGLTPGWRWVFQACGWGDGGAFAGRNDGLCTPLQNGAMADKAIISAVGADGLQIGFGLREKARQLRAVMGASIGQFMGQDAAGFGVDRQVQLAPDTPFPPCSGFVAQMS